MSEFCFSSLVKWVNSVCLVKMAFSQGHKCFSNNIHCAEDRPVRRRLGFVTGWADRTVCFSYPGLLLRRQVTNSCHGVHCSDSLLAPGSMFKAFGSQESVLLALGLGIRNGGFPVPSNQSEQKRQVSAPRFS